MQKRGVSAVVATVLIILITVAAVTIIWTAIIPMIKNNLVAGDITTDLSIDSAGGYTFWDSSSNISCVQVKRGSDDTKITGIQITFSWRGSSESQTANSSYVPGKNQEKIICFDLTGKGEPDSVSVAAVVQRSQGGAAKSTPILGSLDELSSGRYESSMGPPDQSFRSCTANLPCDDSNTCTANDIMICSGGVLGSCRGTNVANGISCTIGGNAGTCQAGVCVSSPSCNYGAWNDVGCGKNQGTSNCAIGQMLQNRTVLSGTGCTSITQCNSTNPTCILISGAVSYWPFDINTKDRLGRNNCTAVGNAAIQNAVLALNDGATDYVDCGNNNTLNPTTSFTASIWVKVLGTPTGGKLLNKEGVSSQGYGIWLQNVGASTRINPYIFVGGSWKDLMDDASCNSDPNCDTIFEPGVWHNYIAIWNGSTFTMYKDNVLKESLAASGAYTPSSVNLKIGEIVGTHSYISDVILFSRSLSASERTSLYNSQNRPRS